MMAEAKPTLPHNSMTLPACFACCTLQGLSLWSDIEIRLLAHVCPELRNHGIVMVLCGEGSRYGFPGQCGWHAVHRWLAALDVFLLLPRECRPACVSSAPELQISWSAFTCSPWWRATSTAARASPR